jgi:uncharacterized RDD family membrane protein YckC
MFDDTDFIETPENVMLERELAGIGLRFVACFIDYLVIAIIDFSLFLLAWAIMGVAFWMIGRVGLSMLIIIFSLIYFLLFWGYFALFELFRNGQTPGKKNQNIRVVMDNGQPVTFIPVAIRNLIRIIDTFTPFGVVCMFITKKWQRFGDLAAGTVVVSEAVHDYSAREGKGKNKQWEKAASPEAIKITNLTPEEFRVLTNYWTRRHEFQIEARKRLLRTLVLPILMRCGRATPNEPLAVIDSHVNELIRETAEAERQRFTKQL